MTISAQSLKYHLSLAGEFHVAAQLHRFGVSAAVTYGNAKSADVVAFNALGDEVVVVEVKSTSQGEWVVGNRVPTSASKPWVFVHLPADPTESPAYFVLLQSDLYQLLKEGEQAYLAKYEQKHGEPYGDRKGVIKLKRSQAEPFRDNWEKIINLLNSI